MSNPFLEPSSLLVELERQRRHRFQVGVYALLGGLLCMLMGLLIQGCQTARPKTVTPLDSTPTLSTNPTTNATLAASTQPETNAAPVSVATPGQEAVRSTPAPSAPPTGEGETARRGNGETGPSGQDTSVSTKAAATPTTYVVKPGDSLSRIAKAHGTTVAVLKAANGLKSDKIAVGKKLKIPSTKGSSTAPEQ